MMRLVAVAGNSCFTTSFVNSALDNFLVSGSEIFINFSIKRGVGKLPQSFFLVEGGRRTKQPKRRLCWPL